MNLIEKTQFVYRAWRYRYKVEKSEIAFLRKNLSSGQTAVDIGAHKGAFTYWMQNAVGRSGRVIAFEPQPELANHLEQVKHHFGYAQVTVVNSGLSSAPGTMTLFRPGRDPSPGATFERQAHHNFDDTISVSVESLDHYFENHPGRPVHFIKCDVEGHELDVFHGGKTILREDCPILLFECERRHHKNGEITEVFDFLNRIDYEGYFFQNGAIRPLVEYQLVRQTDAEAEDYVYNFFFIPNSRSQP